MVCKCAQCGKEQNKLFPVEGCDHIPSSAHAVGSTAGAITVEDLRKLVKDTPLSEYKIVRVSDEWAVILVNGKPDNAIEWKRLDLLNQ